MKVRKKIPYYILGVAAVVVLSLLGPLRQMGDGSISVLTGIVRLSRATLQESTAETAFRAYASPWMYTLMPIVASLPSVSFIYEELKSRFYRETEFRKGRNRYVYSRFLYSAVSGAVTVTVGLAVYALVVCCIFPVNPVGIEIIGYTEISIWELVLYLSSRILYVAVYGMAMSVLASFLVYVYPNLYVDLSLLFIAAYMLSERAMMETLIFPLILLVVMAMLYGFMWRVRSEHI